MMINVENPQGLPELHIWSNGNVINFLNDKEIYVVLYDKQNEEVLHQGSCYNLALNNNKGIETTVLIGGLGLYESMILEVRTSNENIHLDDILCKMHDRKFKQGDSVVFDGEQQGMVRAIIAKEGEEYAIVEVLNFRPDVIDKFPVYKSSFDLKALEIPTKELRHK